MRTLREEKAMSREYVRKPVWTWYCDQCGRSSGELAWQQSRLSSLETMRAAGWYIAQIHGDRCPDCLAKRAASGQEPIHSVPTEEDS